MNRRFASIGIGAYLCVVSMPVHAGVIVSTTIDMTRLSVTPSAGTFQLQSPFSAGAFAQAQDSLGGFAQQFNPVDDSSTSASAATALASAAAAASVVSRTASATSGVTIGTAASASSTAQGALGPAFGVGQGLFEIVSGTSASANVTFNVTLAVDQLLQTDAYGISANSETIFQLLLPDFPNQPLLFFDTPLSIGPSSVNHFTDNPTLTGSITLQTNTPYTLIAEVDAESSGVSTVPEPSEALLTVSGLVAVLYFSRLSHAKPSRATR